MNKKYCFDACIYIDYYNDRFGPGGRPLGGYAGKLFLNVIEERDTIIFSESTIRELQTELTIEQIERMFVFLFALKILEKVEIYKEDRDEADKLSSERKVPFNDALNAVLARNNSAIVISQDHHYDLLADIANKLRPDDSL